MGEIIWVHGGGTHATWSLLRPPLGSAREALLARAEAAPTLVVCLCLGPVLTLPTLHVPFCASVSKAVAILVCWFFLHKWLRE